MTRSSTTPRGWGPGPKLFLAILLAVVTGGAGAALVGATGAVSSAVADAVFVGMENTAINSAISNKGDLGATLKGTFSGDAIKGYAVSGLTAGFTAGMLNDAFGVSGDDIGKATHGFDLSNPVGIGQFVSYTAAQQAFQATAQTAIQGGSLKDNLGHALSSAAEGTLEALAFNAVGDLTAGHADGGPEKIAIHAFVGGLLSAAEGGKFETGALAAGANEALLPYLVKAANQNPQLLVAFSQIVGVVAAGTVGGDAQQGAGIAASATSFNYLNHQQVDQLVKDLAGCDRKPDAAGCRADVKFRYKTLSDMHTGISVLGCSFEECGPQYVAVKGGSDALDQAYNDNSQGLSKESLEIVQGFQDSNQIDYDLAQHKAVQGNNQEVAGIVLTGGFGSATGASKDVALGAGDLAGEKGAGAGLPSGEAGVIDDAVPVANGAGFTGEKGTAPGLASGETGVVGTGKDAVNGVSFDGAKATSSGLVSGETGVVSTGKAAANDASFDGPEGLGSKVDDLLPNLNTRVLTETEARALGGENKGLIYVAEGPKGNPAAQDFQAGTNGAFTDLATGKGGVPALRYTNPNENGVNFIKFDGIETAVDGSSVMLIDAKTKLAIWSPSTQKSVLDTLQRVKSAVDQNPGYKVVYEFPNQKVEAQAKAFIRSNGFDSIVSTRTRTP